MELTVEQQRKMLNYSLIFLKNEIPKLQNSVVYCKNESSKKLLLQRLRELEKDEEELEKIGDMW